MVCSVPRGVLGVTCTSTCACTCACPAPLVSPAPPHSAHPPPFLCPTLLSLPSPGGLRQDRAGAADAVGRDEGSGAWVRAGDGDRGRFWLMTLALTLTLNLTGLHHRWLRRAGDYKRLLHGRPHAGARHVVVGQGERCLPLTRLSRLSSVCMCPSAFASHCFLSLRCDVFPSPLTLAPDPPPSPSLFTLHPHSSPFTLIPHPLRLSPHRHPHPD